LRRSPFFESAGAADLHPAAITYILPDKTEWKLTSPGAQQAILTGDLSKSGFDFGTNKWLSGDMGRPRFHPIDRFIAVLRGTWWVITRTTFDPAAPPAFRPALSSPI
jgi:hypothetical protein